MTRLISALFLLFAMTLSAVAQDAVPDRRLVVSKDVDFYGADLQALFDTTFDTCKRVCLAETKCKAFTFNAKSNACFPKSEVSEKKDYEGAWSAIVLETSAATKALARKRLGELYFLSSADTGRAVRQADAIGGLHPGGNWTIQVLLEAVEDRLSKNNSAGAIHWMGAVASQSDLSAHWSRYGQLLMTAAETDTGNRDTYRGRALSAFVNAYLRTDSDPERATILEDMAGALEVNRRGRDMIPALRLANDITPRDDLVARIDDAVGKYGFRVVEHTVESDLASPRVCAEFNEPLVKTGVDYETFVRAPQQGLSVEAAGARICVAGLTHGERTTITFRAGLPAESGEKLIKDVPLAFYIRDRSPAVRFPGRAYVFPKSPDAGLPIETVNLETLNLTLRRVSDRNLLRVMQDRYFGRPLSYWEFDSFGSDIAEEIWTGTAKVLGTLNHDSTTRLPMGEVLGDMEPGIYALTARIPGVEVYDDAGATQWFVLSDLGVTTLQGTDGLHVFVRGLGDAAARPGATVTLIARSNRILGTATTDAEGHALFDPGLTRGTGGASPAMVTVEEPGRDLAFLSLTDPAFDLSDRGVAGREPAPPVDVFLATDRGAYRAGETIHATVLARDGVAHAIPGLPVTAILTRPDGVEYSRILSTDDIAGTHVFDLPVGSTAPRGTWRLDIKADPDAPALASRSILVEDFMPERIDFALDLPEGPINPLSPPLLGVDAKYLFGAPAADLQMEGQIFVRAAPGLADWPGYAFGRYDERFSPTSDYFAGSEATDEDGKAQLALELPAFDTVNRPLEAKIVLRVLEGSGRPVERDISRAIAPFGPMIGIKPLFDGVVAESTEAGFDLIAVGTDLKPVEMPVAWTLNRVRTHYHWYQLYGEWNWEASTSRTPVARGTATLGAGPINVSAPVEWGRYELVVQSIEDDSVTSAQDFYAGWYAPADTLATPDTLELSLDQPGYRTGDVATLRIVPRYAGTALVSVMSNRLIAMKAVAVTEGENLIPLDVTDDWGAGAYVTAQVIRPMDVAAGQNPARALGLSYAKVDPGARQLAVAMDAPAESQPRGPLDAAVRVDGVSPGETAWVTVAAVDVGILNLTRFQSPDPSDHYFGQRRLGVEIRDIYGRLIDGMNGAMGQIRSGGDAGIGSRFESPPPTEELVAFFSGPVEVGADGLAHVSFDIPEFNGTVRLMAVAWSPTGVGQAAADVLVRDPVVITASVPRFLAPGDQSRLLLEIVHATGPSGRIGLDVTALGLTLPQAVPSGLDLKDKGKQVISVPIMAEEEGDFAIRIALTTPDGRLLTKSLNMPVRVNDPEVATTRRFSLGAGKTFTFDDEVFDGLRMETASAMLSAGPLARFDVPGLLSSLDRYPYGCTEQITSKAMPLLYLSSVAQAMGLAHADRTALRVDQAIERVLTRQAANGAFGLWRADSGDFWLDAYVTDFLSRARAQGHAVPQIAFRNALDNLRNRVNYAPDFDSGGEEVAYALMVLAREGAAAMGDLRYYADVKGEAFTSPLAAAQLGAALASYGDQVRADAMFARAAQQLKVNTVPEGIVWRVDYGTALRDAAAVLSLAVESGSSAVNRESLVNRIAAFSGPMSTQEQTWALMAAKALVSDPTVSGIRLNGQQVEGPMVRRIEAGGEALAITNSGTTATDITLTTFGKPNQPVSRSGYGYVLDRSYFTMEGKPVAGPIRAGDRMVVVLRVTSAQYAESRLIVNDPLPAGLEIDNPSLLQSGDVRALDWLKTASAESAEFRSDRFIAAVNRRSKEPFELAYIVRAISPGAYHHPAATVEDMYRPEYRARTDQGRMTIGE